ncbi:MAG TPA: hypothetical protein VF188_10910 [Longimicrobiales bacterium]
MTETPNEVRKPAGRMNWLWITIAVVVVGGFLVWLGVNGTGSSAPTAEESSGGEMTDKAAAATITLADLAAGAATYVGQVVRLDSIEVTSLMGSQSFWTLLPDRTPYLVKLGPALVQSGTTVQRGDRVTVSGRVVEMTDSVIAAWEQQGAIQDEGQRAQAEFATTFIEATEAIGGSARRM